MILQLKDISGGYDKGHQILEGVCLDVQARESVGIIGLNGSGKSTLSKAVMNMLPHRTGEVCFNGEDISAEKARDISNKGISIFLQGGVVFDELTVWDNLLLAANYNSDRIEEVRNATGFLTSPKRKLINTSSNKLSGGERHQLALAMCLLRRPMLLILDEPSAGLSPVAAKSLYEILEKVRAEQKLTMLVIEQNIALAAAFCNRVCLLEKGKINNISLDNKYKDIESLIF